MRYLTACALLSALAGVAPAAPLAPVQSAPLTAPCEPHRSVTLTVQGHPTAVVVIPQAAGFAAAAEQAAVRLDTALGARLPRVAEQQYRPDGRTAILCGNCFSGPLVRRLYANHLICADGGVPGSGYELRTVPAALDLGDVVFLGGSTPAGVGLAAEALCRRLQPGADRQVPYLVECTGLVPRPGAPTAEQIAAQVQGLEQVFGSFTSQKIEQAIARLEAAAQGFYLTGDDGFGKLYGRLLETAAAYYRASKSAPPTFLLPRLVMSLDQVEESAGLTPAQRLLGAEWLRLIIEDTMGFWEMSRPKRLYAQGRQSVAWNHETHPCLAVAQGAQYLRSHYQLPACGYWEAVCENLFAGQVDVDQPLEDSANYQWLVHQHLAEYVLVTGHLPKFLSGPGFRAHLEYALASHDALGDEATHGDAWQPFGSIAGLSFTLGNVCYDDPRYGYLLDLVGRPRPGSLWQYAGGTPSREPADHVGLRVFTVAPARAAALGLQLPPERALDKAVFRSGWSPSGNYLMLDGLSVGNHKHVDANAIIRYRANRRLWLVDMDYIRAAPWHHNTIQVTRDGLAPDQRPADHDGAQVIASQPFGAELAAAVSGSGLALTRSTLPDYDGLDWSRTLFWSAAGEFLVVDDLVARQPGEYLTRCLWRTLGDAAWQRSTLTVTQRGERYAGSKYLRLLQDEGREVVELTHPDAKVSFTRELAAGTYGVSFVARGPNGSADSLWLQLDDGPLVDYHLPQDSYGDSSGAPLGAAPGKSLVVPTSGPHRLTITLREAPGPRLDSLVLIAPDGARTRLGAASLVADQITRIDDPAQAFYLVNGDGASGRLTQQLDYGHGAPNGYYAGYPYAGPVTSVLAQTRRQRLAAGQRLQYVNLCCSGPAEAPAPTLRRVAPQAWLADRRALLLAAVGPLRLDGLEVQAQACLIAPTGLVAAGATAVKLGAVTWTAARATDLKLGFTGTGDGLSRLTPATVEKLLRALPALPAPAPAPSPVLSAPAGRPLLPQPQAAVTALASAAGLLAVGDAAGQVSTLSPEGVLRWHVDAGSAVRALAPLRRPEGVCWAVGTAGGEVLLLAPDGTTRWRYRCEPYHGRPGAVATVFGADLDGDGSQEVVAGSENHHYHALEAGGRLLWRTETVHASTVGTAADLNADGRDEVLAGTEYYWPRLLDSSGAQLRSYSGGPVTSAVATLPAAGAEGPLALFGMEDCYVRATRPGAGWLWEANVGGTPRRILPLPAPGPAALAVASSMEAVVFLDRAGQRLAQVALPAPASDLALAGGTLLAACEDGVCYAVAPGGEARPVARADAPLGRLVAVDDRSVAAAAGKQVLRLALP